MGTEYRYFRCTEVVVLKGNEILLGLKKRGFGCGKWNGFGGKLEPGETVERAAVREIYEESGLRVYEADLQRVGLFVHEYIRDDLIIEINFFKTSVFTGIPTESEEMRPKWFTKDSIPFDAMWEDNHLWYEHVFSNSLVYGVFIFDGDNMLSNKMYPVKSVKEMEKMRDSTKRLYALKH